MSTSRTVIRTTGVAARAMLVFTLVLGLGYTLVITVVGLALPAQANGSLVRDAGGTVVGSSLIGQSFTDDSGAALPRYFQSRPSAAGDGYDGAASSGSNLGPNNADLVAAIEERRSDIAELEAADAVDVPADAVTASGSGLDPHISPEYAALQAPRVAAERDLAVAEVEELVAAHTAARDLGFLGEPRVNVVELNLALDALEGPGEN